MHDKSLPTITMNLHLVYRVLYRISVWSIYGFYSEVYIEGEENVPEDGPIIVCVFP